MGVWMAAACVMPFAILSASIRRAYPAGLIALAMPGFGVLMVGLGFGSWHRGERGIGHGARRGVQGTTGSWIPRKGSATSADERSRARQRGGQWCDGLDQSGA